MFTAEQIAGMADKYVSHYEGYTGEGDIHLDFDGDNQNFAMEGSEAKQFTITVGNTAVATRTMSIYAGIMMADLTNQPGQLTDGAFNDTTGAAGLTGASTVAGKTIELLKKFLLYNPTRLVGIKLQSDVSAQMQQAFTIKRWNPFVTDKDLIIYPGNKQSQNVFQDKILIFDAEFQFGPIFNVLYNVVASSNLTITFF
ncbi:MAG TPA: hypothetical protein VN026_18620, partial [Bacteroidia bacterium]|nr:hypothetical protein [Bacteroidia bacterium]